jgi:hypothetical protein
MHRAEDDSETLAQSPDFSDHRAIARDEDRELKRWLPGTPEDSQRDAASRGLDAANTTNRDVNPGHHPRKRDTDAPRGLGDGELMEQPASTAEARQPGADTPEPD